MKRMLAFLAVAGTLGIAGSASATPGNSSSLLDRVRDDPAVIRRHDALARLGSLASNTTSSRVSISQGSASFDWSDAAVGFASGIALIGFGGALRTRVQRRARAMP